jgi:hypothetical protein
VLAQDGVIRRGNRRLTILHADPGGENRGLLHLHVISAIELLEPLGWSIDVRTPLDPNLTEAVLGPDLLLVQMLVDPEVEAIIRCRGDRGLPTVYEITDNFLGVGDWLPSTNSLRSPLSRQSILYHAHLADAMQMLVPALAELFSGVNERRIVLDPFVAYPERVPEKPDGFVFGWAGSRSHASGLAAAAPAVIEFCSRHPEARFAFMGDREMFDDLFAEIAPEQTVVRPFSQQAELLAFTAGLHVGIAPMPPTPFNETRSDNRVCGYAGQGVAAVLEDSRAHRPHARHARIYRSAEELLDTLEELFADPDQVRGLAAGARAWLESERSPEALAAQRDTAYRSLLVHPAAAEGPPPALDDLAARLREAYRSGPEQALAACLELVAECPGYQQAHLLAAHCLEAMGRDDEALDYVEGVDASAVYADLFAELCVRAARRVRPADADRRVAAVRSPFRRARLEAGRSPVERSLAVLEHNPYDHFALASTIRRLSRRDPGSPELDELYERFCLLHPESVPPERRPERQTPFLPA